MLSMARRSLLPTLVLSLALLRPVSDGAMDPLRVYGGDSLAGFLVSILVPDGDSNGRLHGALVNGPSKNCKSAVEL